MIKAGIQFRTATWREWYIVKTFKNQPHMDNFIEYICRTKGYTLDEVWHLNK
jgi:hypothetical protein